LGCCGGLSGGDEESTLNLLYNTSVPSIKQYNIQQSVQILHTLIMSRKVTALVLHRRRRSIQCVSDTSKQSCEYVITKSTNETEAIDFCLNEHTVKDSMTVCDSE